jgi:hypothetical protein
MPSKHRIENCCPRCGEDRLLDEHGSYFVCQVCTHRWFKVSAEAFREHYATLQRLNAPESILERGVVLGNHRLIAP